MGDYISKGATLSACGTYRYRLWREWRNGDTPRKNWVWLDDENGKPSLDGAGHQLGSPKSVVFIMLNPSTADANIDDPTIRRCVGFAKAWNYDRIDVVNLFAYRTKSPAELLKLGHKDDPVGPENLRHIRDLVLNDDLFGTPIGLIVCAWGTHGTHLGQNETMLGWLEDQKRYALHLSKDGHPGHPLYLPANSALVEYRP